MPLLNTPFTAWTDRDAKEPKGNAAIGRWLVRLKDLVSRQPCSDIGQIERVVEVLRQIEHVPNPKSSTISRSQGAKYASDPFHAHEIHRLLRSINLAEYINKSSTAGIGAVSSFLRSGDQTGNLTRQQIEDLTFTIQYLQLFGGDNPATQLKFAPTLPDWWKSTFQDRNLRFLACSDGSGSGTSPLLLNTMLNEWLEHIRLRFLFGSADWMRVAEALSRNENLEDQDKRRLASWIYTSIVTVEEFAESSTWICYANLELLAELAVQIPFSWFSADFTSAILDLSSRYKTALQGKKQMSEEWKRIGTSSTTLLAVYVRKADNPTPPVNQILDHLTQLAANSNLAHDQPEMILPIIESLCSTAGRSPPEIEQETATKLVDLIRTSRSTKGVIATESGAAAIAHFLVASSSLGAIDTLCRGLLSLSSSSSGPALSLDEGIKVTQLFQVALYSRLGESTTHTKTGVLDRVLTALKIKKPVIPENKAADNIIHAVEPRDEEQEQVGLKEAIIARAYASTGLFWASVAHSNANKDDLGAKGVRRTAEVLAWDSLAEAASQSIQENSGTVEGKRAVLYCANQSLAAAPSFGEKVDASEVDLPNLLGVSLRTVLEDPDALGLGPNFFSNLAQEFYEYESSGAARTRTFVTSHAHKILDGKTGRGPKPYFYAEMGRVSRSVGVLMARSWAKGQFDEVLENARRLRAFVGNLAAEWSTCPFSNPQIQTNPSHSETATLFWEYFKMVLFSVVSITRTLVVDEIASPRRAASASDAAIAADQTTAAVFVNVLETFRDLHFVASRMGSEGFGPWREVIVDIADWFGDRVAEENRKEGEGQGWGMDSAVRALFEGMIDASEDNPVRQSQELFCLLFVRQTLPVLQESFVANQVMPRIERYTLIDPRAPGTPTDLDLFEVGHGIAAQLFDNASHFRNVAEEFAPKYVELLFDGYPERIDFDLVRRSFSSVVRGLSFGARTTAAEDIDVTQADHSLGSGEDQDLSSAEQEESGQQGDGEMEDVDAVRHCLDRLYDEIERRTVALRDAKDKAPDTLSWTETRRRDGQLLLSIIEALRNGAPQDLEDKGAWSQFLKLPKDDLSRVAAERGQLMVVLIDQIRSVSLEVLPELLDALGEELLLTDQIDGEENSPLWKFAFNAISSSRAFDATKKRYCVDWYLRLSAQRRAQLRELRGRGVGTPPEVARL